MTEEAADSFARGMVLGITLSLAGGILIAVLNGAYQNSQCIQAGYYGHASTASRGGLYCTKMIGASEIVIVPYKEHQP